jgi:hypothetical protein
MSMYILNEVETSHHLILIRLYFILTILITEDDHNHIVFDWRPSKMGDVATLLFVHFNFIIQLRNMFLFLKSIHIVYQVKFMLCLLSFIMLCFCFCFLKICIMIQWYVRSVWWKKWRSLFYITWICRSAVRN